MVSGLPRLKNTQKHIYGQFLGGCGTHRKPLGALVRAGWPPWYPTIGAALLAELPVIDFVCPACRVRGHLDLRTIDRHPHATIGVVLIPQISCTRCRQPPICPPIGVTIPLRWKMLRRG